MKSHRTELPYAARPRLVRLRRWAPLVVAVLVVGLLGIWHGRTAYEQVQYLYEQRKLLTHSLPADTVVYEHQNGNVQQLLQDRKRYTVARDTGLVIPALKPGAAFYYTPHMDTLVPAKNMDGIAYLHERAAPDGAKRLVVVWIDSYERMGDFEEYLAFTTSALEPAGWRLGSRLRRAGKRRVELTNRFYHTDQLRIFAGQSDAADASRFTIRYSMQGQEGFLDGQLNTSDTVILTVRDGPLWERVGPEQRSRVKGEIATAP